MPPIRNDDHNERSDSASIENNETRAHDVLEMALDAEDAKVTTYHLREALQILEIENNEEVGELLNKALNTENTDTREFLIREAVELLDIETTVLSANRRNPDQRGE